MLKRVAIGTNDAEVQPLPPKKKQSSFLDCLARTQRVVNESPMFGLSNTRCAIQAFQLKEAIPLCLTRLASDWNLSDALAKKKKECRQSLEYFPKHRRWMLKFDPAFMISSRKQKAVSGSPAQQWQQQVMSSEGFLYPCNSCDFIPCMFDLHR